MVFNNGLILQYGILQGTLTLITFPLTFSNNYSIQIFSVAAVSSATWHAIAANKTLSNIGVWLGQYMYEGAPMSGFTHNYFAIGN